MTWDSQLEDLMTDTVEWYPRTGVNAYGETGFAVAPTVLKCQITKTPRKTTTDTGDTVIASARIIIAGAPGISVHDRLVIPGVSTEDDTPILVVKRYTDDTGVHHEEVALA